MPRYYFHIDNGTAAPDPEGTVLSGLPEARAEAVSLAGAVLRDLDGEFWKEGSPWTMHVTDEHDRLLFSLHFGAEIPTGEVTYSPVGKKGG